MKIGNSLKNSLFIRSFVLAKSSPGKIGLIVLFDLLFIMSFLALKKLFEYFAKSLLLPSGLSGTFFHIIFSLAYYLIILLAYSFFKYCILDSLKSLHSKSSFSFSRLGRFYLLNTVVTGIFFAISLIAGLFLINIKPAYQIYFYFIIASPYWIAYNEYSIFSLHSLLFYIVLNLSQSLFYEHSSLKKALKISFESAFSKAKIYSGIIAPIIMSSVIFGLLLFGIGYLIRLSAQNYAFYSVAYSYFALFSKWAVAIVIYLIILVNRVSFYNVSKEMK